MKYMILFLVLFVSACSSVPRNYYSLGQSDTVQAVATANNQKINGIQLNLGQIPQQYDRPQIVIFDEKISPQVYVLNDSLWVSSLQDQIQRTLSNDVAHYLGVPDVNGIPNLKNIKQFTVRIVNFDMTLNKGSFLEANWSDSLDGQNTQLCKATIKIDGPAQDVAALVDTQKEALRALAAIIALHNQINSTEISKKIVSYKLGCT